MYGVEFDIRSMCFADGPRVGFRWVGRPHQLTILFDGIVTLQHKDDGRPGRHEAAEAPERRARFMYGIKPLSHGLRHVNQLDRHRLQPGLLIAIDNISTTFFFTASGLMMANVLSLMISTIPPDS